MTTPPDGITILAAPARIVAADSKNDTITIQLADDETISMHDITIGYNCMIMIAAQKEEGSAPSTKMPKSN
jgi:hypothetical protein